MNFKGCLFILITVILWALIGPLSKFTILDGVSPFENAFWRSLFAWVFFTIHAIKTKQTKIERKDYPYILAFAILGITIFYASYQFAVQETGASLASVLLYTAPAWVAILSHIFLKEKITPVKIAVLIMTIIGVLLVSFGGDETSSSNITILGIGMGLVAGFTYALYYIFGKLCFYKYSTSTIFMYALPLGALGLYPLFDHHPMEPSSWLAIVVLAVVCTFTGNMFYYAGLARLEATVAAVIATFEPVLAAFIAWWWWDEKLLWTGYLGSALILSGVFLVVFESKIKSYFQPSKA